MSMNFRRVAEALSDASPPTDQESLAPDDELDQPADGDTPVDDADDEATSGTGAGGSGAPCSYCGSSEFDPPEDNGKVQRARCTACGGTMVSHDGTYWQPDLIGQPDNHPRTDADPSTGGIGGAAAAPVVLQTNDLSQKTAMPGKVAPPPGLYFDTYDAPTDSYHHEEGEESHPGWTHHLLRAHDPAVGTPGVGVQPHMVGSIYYSRSPEGAEYPGIAVHDMRTIQAHQGKGIASAMQDELRRQHPQHMIDHGSRTPAGQRWRDQYTDPGDPKLDLDHPDNVHEWKRYRPTNLAEDLATKDLSHLGAVDWCRHRHAEHCWLPRQVPGNGLALYEPQDRGRCPWTTASQQQINCPVSEPGPMAGMTMAGAKQGLPEDAEFHFTPSPGHPHQHHLEMQSGGTSVGHIKWAPRDGDVQIVDTDHKYRRRGIGTALVTKAHELSASMGMPGPNGSVFHTHDGSGLRDHLDSSDERPSLDHIPTVMHRGKGEDDTSLHEHLIKHHYPTSGEMVRGWGPEKAEEIHDKITKFEPCGWQKQSSLAELPTDPEFGFHLVATWADVRRKAKRIRAEGGVHVVVASGDGIAGHVQGDTGVYETMLTYALGTAKVADWTCGCIWAAYAWNRSPAFKRFEGRMCSHALALQYEAQSRGMFGQTVREDRESPAWLRDKVRQRYDRDSGVHDLVHATRRDPLDPEGFYQHDHGLDLARPPVYAFAVRALAQGADPAATLGEMLALGMQHAAAQVLVQDAISAVAGYDPYGEWDGREDDEESEAHSKDWDDIHSGIESLHRGVGVMLHPHDHAIVHDPHRPVPERAQHLLSVMQRHTDEPGIGTHWTPSRSVAEDFSDDNVARHLAGESKRDHMRRGDHTWGHDPDGDPKGQPATSVVFHAHRPDRDVIDEHPDEMAHGSSSIYGFHDHGEHEVPIRPGSSMDLKGISWKAKHDDYDEPADHDDSYTHHDFGGEGHPVTAALPGPRHQTRCPDCGQPVSSTATKCPHCGADLGMGDTGDLHLGFRVDAAGPEDDVWWHGTATGDLRGGNYGLHLGTHKAATDALTSTIGHPAEGVWDGSRAYGETKLAGKKTLTERGLNHTGYNMRAPEEDHYPTGAAKHGNDDPISMDARPDIFPAHITGPMGNTPHTPHTDANANSMMRSRGGSHGYYYRNVGEDPGSISAVVPHHSHIERIGNNAPGYDYHNTTKYHQPLKDSDYDHGFDEDEDDWHHLGALDVEDCPTCNGRGTVQHEETEFDDGGHETGTHLHQTRCEDCQGSGRHAVMADDERTQQLSERQREYEQRFIDHAMKHHLNGEGVGAACTPRWCPLLRQAAKEPLDVPTHAGVALKAADTGRVLMIQRSHKDEKDPAAGTWEFPGGGREEGDPTSLHSGIREFEEEVGQPFPLGGHVQHVWRSPNGVYQGHVVVVPSEDALDFSNGRSTVNPDDPDGDDHEQSAWWHPDDARKNPAIRDECKDSPWKHIKAASLHTAALSFEEHMRTADYAATDPLEELGPGAGERPASTPIPLDPAVPQNPGSTGFATAGDPPAFDHDLDTRSNQSFDASLHGDYEERKRQFAENVMAHYRALEERDALLHREPEPALPATEGGDDDSLATGTPGERFRSQMTPEIGPTDLSANPSSVHASKGSTADIVAQFQATAAAKSLQTTGGASDMDIASAARDFLATGATPGSGMQKAALKDFSFSEQQALINEGAGTVARNLGSLDIGDTHYAALEAALQAEELGADTSDLFI